MKFPKVKILNTEPSRFSDYSLAKLRQIADIYEYESEHEGMPVLKGEKIGLNIWLTDK